jgi:hypothetical protein
LKEVSIPYIRFKEGSARQSGARKIRTNQDCVSEVSIHQCSLSKDSDEVDELKREKESLRQQLGEIKQANKNIKVALRGMTS